MTLRSGGGHGSQMVQASALHHSRRHLAGFHEQRIQQRTRHREIQKILKISPGENHGFRCNLNDLEMLAAATESYAVANAAEPVRKAAKHITDTNVNDGVLKVLRTLL